MRKFIRSIPSLALLNAFTTAINNALTPLATFKINLNNDDKVGMRSMAEGREGFARLISRIATQFPDALSRADSPAELADLLNFYANLEANRMAILQALETIEDMQLGTANDIMTLVDRYSANLKISRNNESALDLAMAEVDNWNSRFGARPGNTSSPTAE